MAVLVAVLHGCNHDGSEQTTLRQAAESFVPQDAADRTVAPDLPWVQISFNVRRPWLQFAIDEKRIFRAKAEGWALCQATSSEWDGYQDFAVTPPRYTRLKTYILYRDGVMLTLIGRYDRPIAELPLGKRDERPIQQGFVIARKATEKEGMEAAANMRLSCDRHVQADEP
jgi:hypothetical protein